MLLWFSCESGGPGDLPETQAAGPPAATPIRSNLFPFKSILDFVVGGGVVGLTCVGVCE